MAVEESAPAAGTPARNAYGRYIRERGTLRILILAAVLVAAYYAYEAVHHSLMAKVKWPALQPDAAGLTVVGLQDKPRPGWQPTYKAFEINHAWQIRRPDDTEESGDTGPDQSPEAKDRGNDPSAGREVNRGEAVDPKEVLATCPVVLTGRQFTGATVDQRVEQFFDRDYWEVNVYLTDEGRSRYEQFSGPHDQERLAFILNNEVLTCPRMDHMDVGMLTIGPIWIKADAQKLADFINHKKSD